MARGVSRSSSSAALNSLTNNLPAAAGNPSILFPGFTPTFTNGTPGLLTQEAAHGNSVTYTFLATTPGTHSYYSGTQGDLQIEMGLYGAIIVLPSTIDKACASGLWNYCRKACLRSPLTGRSRAIYTFRSRITERAIISMSSNTRGTRRG